MVLLPDRSGDAHRDVTHLAVAALSTPGEMLESLPRGTGQLHHDDPLRPLDHRSRLHHVQRVGAESEGRCAEGLVGQRDRGVTAEHLKELDGIIVKGRFVQDVHVEPTTEALRDPSVWGHACTRQRNL